METLASLEILIAPLIFIATLIIGIGFFIFGGREKKG